MVECVLRTWIPPLPANVGKSRDITAKLKKGLRRSKHDTTTAFRQRKVEQLY